MTEPLFPNSRDDHAAPPAALRAVAWVFVALGVLALLGMTLHWLGGRFTVNPGIFALFVGWGLLRSKPAWRTRAIVFIWIGLVLVPVVLLLGLYRGWPAYFGGRTFDGQAGAVVRTATSAVFIIVLLWQHHVLSRADVRRHFDLADERATG